MNRDTAEKLYNENAKKLFLAFESYYKYSFSFSGSTDNIYVAVQYGGSSDYIYRYEVDTSAFKAPKTFDDLMETYYDVTIKDLKTGEKFSDYHY